MPQNSGMEEGRMRVLRVMPEAKFEPSKRLICPEKIDFLHAAGSPFLIHNLTRVTLWTSPIFLCGSSALAIGYFLRNFLVSFQRTRSVIPTAAQ